MNNSDSSLSAHQQPGNAVKQPSAAGFWRRMAAILYDSLLLLAAFFLATAIALPLNNGEAFHSDQYIFSGYLIVISFAFFGWFWTHGGQTPGMKAWKLKLITSNQSSVSKISWKLAAKRFMSAILSWVILGTGFVSILFSKQKLAWHDRLSNSRIIDCG
ncbi:MAG: RDD family protein [Methylococcales bacterium]